MSEGFIRLRGARQNNLKGVNADVPKRALTVVTGVSGSGKSSFAVDTLHAEGYRRYVETFSSYARQFLDRIPAPRLESIEGITPSIAIESRNRVRTSRSTVGTVTEINDYLKYLFLRASVLHCGKCGRPISRSSPSTVFTQLLDRAGGGDVLLAFGVRPAAETLSGEEQEHLMKAGFTRVLDGGEARKLPAGGVRRDAEGRVIVVVDRVKAAKENRTRMIDSIETALRYGQGEISAILPSGGELRFSTKLECPDCGVLYREPSANLFSFNSPIGACPRCRGFGRVIGVDLDAVIPDGGLSIAQGAVRPWQSKAGKYCQVDLLRYCRRAGIPKDVPFSMLSEKQRRAVIEGDGEFYGVRGFFDWLETKAYRMHVRVFLSRYRSFDTCPQCRGSRFKPETLLYRLGDRTIADACAAPVRECREFFVSIRPSLEADPAARGLLDEISRRLGYLEEAGLPYLALDRASRTLSAGEMQRVSLTRCLGSSLVNTLFVLDEPTTGLHARDVRRLSGILRRLGDSGNTAVVVEHDPGVIASADHLIELGPGAAESGGEIVYSGPYEKLVECRDSVTAAYLSGRKRIPLPERRRPMGGVPAMTVRGASLRNLKSIDVSFPLGRFVCVAGVSGSGKSTLVVDTLVRSLEKKRPVGCRAVEGDLPAGGVVLVDQEPIAASPRSNAATYLGLFGAVRKAFAETDEARALGLGASDFSFNGGRGRCVHCRGEGFERVEMQFLPDALVPCPFCGGRRYGIETLDVRLRDRTIADFLDMDAASALDLFGDLPGVAAPLGSMCDVGLGYLRLGQPANTFSAGEAQRLKLARHVSKADRKTALFVFDEPSVGMHLDDVAKLVCRLDALVEEGHSVVVVEHNIELLKCADWIIDLGPEAGDEGGRVTAQGAPEEIAKSPDSRTGEALRPLLGRKLHRKREAKARAAPAENRHDCIRVSGAREHNLKDLNASIPLGKLVALTGVSGSGKSSLAFDVLFTEGQRRYLDTLTPYARQFIRQLDRPDVEEVSGIPPSIAMEQRVSQAAVMSTVATLTEIYNYLRLLYAKRGVRHCPDCGVEVSSAGAGEAASEIDKMLRRAGVSILAPLVRGRKGLYRELLDGMKKRGIRNVVIDGVEHDLDAAMPSIARYREHDISAVVAKLSKDAGRQAVRAALAAAFELGRGMVEARGRTSSRVFSLKRVCSRCGRGFDEPDPRDFSFISKRGACRVCGGSGVEGYEEPEDGRALNGLEKFKTCRACGGARLNPESLAVKVDGRNISEFTALTAKEATAAAGRIRRREKQDGVAAALLRSIEDRCAEICSLGLSYLTLDRPSGTLSTGEARRVRLAAALGSNLCGALYVLDEPTIGLHPADGRVLIERLRQLRDRGNTVLVVEHDEALVRASDYAVDLGPGPGRRGGRIVASEATERFLGRDDSETARMLRLKARGAAFCRGRPVGEDTPRIEVRGAAANNLKGIDASFPAERLVCVSGVSGAGKSSLVLDVLVPAVRSRLDGGGERPRCDGISLPSQIRRVRVVDQSPIGRTPRSVPATYVGFFDDMRRLFAAAPQARQAGYGPSRFSFNVKGGRCEACEGQGRLSVEMAFLPHVYVTCEVCGGRRFNLDTLSVQLRGRSIADVLEMSCEEARDMFRAFPAVERPLGFMCEVGLGYLSLGQPSPTLSGGEAQRVRLAAELCGPRGAGTLYVLDEPTTGLHPADVLTLLAALQAIVDRGDTVLVIEHNLDVLAAADWVMDLGPGGGDDGGRIVAAGTALEVARKWRISKTGAYLKEYFR